MFYLVKNDGIGSSNAMFIRDLKTVKGAIKRTEATVIYQSCKTGDSIKLFSLPDNKVFDEKSYTLVHTFTF